MYLVAATQRAIIMSAKFKKVYFTVVNYELVQTETFEVSIEMKYTLKCIQDRHNCPKKILHDAEAKYDNSRTRIRLRLPPQLF